MKDLFVSLLPLAFILIVFGGALIFFSKRQMKDYGKHVDRVETINDRLVELTEQMNTNIQRNTQVLEEIRDALQRPTNAK